MRITVPAEKVEQAINCGAFGYPPEKVASILELDLEDVEHDLRDEFSTLYKLYKKGQDAADYAIDLKLFELAQSGDLKALEQFNIRKRKRR